MGAQLFNFKEFKFLEFKFLKKCSMGPYSKFSTYFAKIKIVLV